jgi:hypothetical protein
MCSFQLFCILDEREPEQKCLRAFLFFQVVYTGQGGLQDIFSISGAYLHQFWKPMTLIPLKLHSRARKLQETVS